MTIFTHPISEEIWDMKYRLKDADGTPIDQTVEDTWMRVATALADAETERKEYWTHQFYEAMRDFKFLPAGRIIAGAGTDRDVTLFNCFVMGTIPDSMDGIFSMLREAALTMQQGGGIGYDFSTIRPKGALVKGVAADASGPLSFMDVWDAMCRTVMSAGSRRGAMMATMRCDHPDIMDFVNAKRDAARLRMFNLSVLATDEFMQAVEDNEPWELKFDGKVYNVVYARDLWDQIMQATYDVAEPGVIFIDRINQRNPLFEVETISATNPCGEQPLPPYGACLLGSINLAALVKNPFTSSAVLNRVELAKLTKVAVRALDNVVDVSNFPLEEQRIEAKNKRRIGLGVTGLADALAMCRIRYGSEQAVQYVHLWLKVIEQAALYESEDLATEKGAFPLISDTSVSPRRRNSHLTSIAPTGTISLFANNASSGVEPIFANSYTRKVLQPDGTRTEQVVEDYAVKLWREMNGDAPLPEYFVTAQDITWQEHVDMQAAAQAHVDSSISKTINLPKDISFEEFKGVYSAAYDSGCKGCTTYRPNNVTGSVLSVDEPEGEDVKGPDPIIVGAPGSVPERPESLPGHTYKLKWPNAEHAFYVTVNNIVDDAGERPFEVFVATKNVQHQSWITALTRMLSAVFRRGGDVGFVVEELKAVRDVNDTAYLGGKFVPSIQAMIGDVLEKHIAETCGADDVFPWDGVVPVAGDVGEPPKPLPTCGRCGSAAMKQEAGCSTCMSCGQSECG